MCDTGRGGGRERNIAKGPEGDIAWGGKVVVIKSQKFNINPHEMNPLKIEIWSNQIKTSKFTRSAGSPMTCRPSSFVCSSRTRNILFAIALCSEKECKKNCGGHAPRQYLESVGRAVYRPRGAGLTRGACGSSGCAPWG
jgi:hypothetical protein